MLKDAEIIAYIVKGIKNEYIRLSKKVCSIRDHELPLNEDTENPDKDNAEGIETSTVIFEALDTLSELQKMIIKKIFFEDRIENEIASEFHVTRQSVNKTKRRALEKLKDLLENIMIQ